MEGEWKLGEKHIEMSKRMESERGRVEEPGWKCSPQGILYGKRMREPRRENEAM